MQDMEKYCIKIKSHKVSLIHLVLGLFFSSLQMLFCSFYSFNLHFIPLGIIYVLITSLLKDLQQPYLILSIYYFLSFTNFFERRYCSKKQYLSLKVQLFNFELSMKLYQLSYFLMGYFIIQLSFSIHFLDFFTMKLVFVLYLDYYQNFPALIFEEMLISLLIVSKSSHFKHLKQLCLFHQYFEMLHNPFRFD